MSRRSLTEAAIFHLETGVLLSALPSFLSAVRPVSHINEPPSLRTRTGSQLSEDPDGFWSLLLNRSQLIIQICA